MEKKETIYDVAVIGGGPAGMMAAGRAAECGAKVVLIEKNPSLGKKLLITGGGRCNLTNYELDTRRFLAKFRNRQKFLFSPFAQFGVKETVEWFNANGMKTKVEVENRVFPTSNSAKSVLDTLVDYMKENKVKILTGIEVNGFTSTKEKITSLRIKGSKETIKAKSFILATGGKSRPDTGSTGEAFEWLKNIGYNIPESDAALVPIKTKETWVKNLAGISLADVKLKVFQNNKKQAEAVGKLLFTHFGLSGPLVLNMSQQIGELLKYASVEIALDLRPGIDEANVDKELQELLKTRLNKKLANSLNNAVPSALSPILMDLANINPDKAVNGLERKERLSLVKLLKNLPMSVSGLMGVEKAIVTSGGVDLKEIDSKTMRSRLHNNLFLIGDVLNIDRPSGGYSLQLCWTTAHVAGTAATKKYE
ncbi:MAG: NAD(P)/FAD-dependent oxidoreductase [Candidatus Falkowbacteria bacterium]|nr:NAD(P)/FAD-dependent oxidoreductase [Candidatus Falkowbacteria bacterium]